MAFFSVLAWLPQQVIAEHLIPTVKNHIGDPQAPAAAPHRVQIGEQRLIGIGKTSRQQLDLFEALGIEKPA